MAIFEGKTPAERNKIIAAGLLGFVALIALYLAFGRSSSPSTSTTVKVTSPSAKPTPVGGTVPTGPLPTLPNTDDQAFVYETTPVLYMPGNSYAPDAGRNIFAFYEPPPPTPYVYVPTPFPTPPPVKPPTPAPTPIMLATSVSPGNVYAGSKTFRLEVNGDRFTPDARIYFNQAEVPTTFVSPQKLVSQIPAELIAREGSKQVIVQTPDGRAYSDQLMFGVQAPPKPNFQYIGMIGRARFNNDTAYITETGKPNPFGARLNDVVGGRFRLVDITPSQVVVEDVNLGFRHPVPISKASTTPGNPLQPNRGQPDPNTFQNFPPNGIPIIMPGQGQRIVPPKAPNAPRPPVRADVDDDDPPTG